MIGSYRDGRTPRTISRDAGLPLFHNARRTLVQDGQHAHLNVGDVDKPVIVNVEGGNNSLEIVNHDPRLTHLINKVGDVFEVRFYDKQKKDQPEKIIYLPHKGHKDLKGPFNLSVKTAVPGKPGHLHEDVYTFQPEKDGEMDGASRFKHAPRNPRSGFVPQNPGGDNPFARHPNGLPGAGVPTDAQGKPQSIPGEDVVSRRFSPHRWRDMVMPPGKKDDPEVDMPTIKPGEHRKMNVKDLPLGTNWVSVNGGANSLELEVPVGWEHPVRQVGERQTFIFRNPVDGSERTVVVPLKGGHSGLDPASPFQVRIRHYDTAAPGEPLIDTYTFVPSADPNFKDRRFGRVRARAAE